MIAESLQGKRLVIFGAGYVGAAVAKRALAEGVEVVAFTRNAEKAAALRDAGCQQVVIGDLEGTDWHAEISGSVDCVLNCVSSGGGGLEGYRRSYVEGQRSMLTWAEGIGGVGHIVYTSSTSVYPQTFGSIVTEQMDAKGSGDRGAIVRESEDLLRQTSPMAVRMWTILRLAGIYGPGRSYLLKQIQESDGVIGGFGDYHLNMVHRDDIVTAILAAFDKPDASANEVFNVSDGQPPYKAEAATWLAHQVGSPEPRFNPEAPSRRNPLGAGVSMPDRIVSSTKLRKLLAWHPAKPTFREGYADILEGSPA